MDIIKKYILRKIINSSVKIILINIKIIYYNSSYQMVKIVILCGGIGSRLWPISRLETPKQFMRLPGKKHNFFQETVLRIEELELKCSELIIISNVGLKNQITDSITYLNLKCKVTFIWEPIGKNTGPAIASLLICDKLNKLNDMTDDEYIIWPSDHQLCMNSFNKSLKAGQKYIENSIITFGICPTYAETGYGYINGGFDCQIKNFIEKPCETVAKELIKNPDCYWNSGMFYFKANVLLNEYHEKCPQILKMISDSISRTDSDYSYADNSNEHHSNAFLSKEKNLSMCLNGAITETINQIHLDEVNYSKILDIPFDKLIMEQTKIGKVIPFKGQWSDIGSWESLCQYYPPSSQSDNNIIQLDNLNCHIYNYHPNQLITAIGLQNICVVNTHDALLISDLSQTQKVKNIYQQLEEKNSQCIKKNVNNEYSWGAIEQLHEMPDNYQIEKIIVNENQSVSYQNRNQCTLICLLGQGKLLCNCDMININMHQIISLPINDHLLIQNNSHNSKLHLLLMKYSD